MSSTLEFFLFHIFARQACFHFTHFKMDMHKHTTHCTHSRIHTMCPNGHWSSFARHFSLNHPFSKWIYVYCIECMPISEQANENKTSVFHCNWILNYVNENGVFDWISTFGFTKWTRSKCGHSHSQMNGFSSSFSYPSYSFLALFSVLSNFGFRISDSAYIFKFHEIKLSNSMESNSLNIQNIPSIR